MPPSGEINPSRHFLWPDLEWSSGEALAINWNGKIFIPCARHYLGPLAALIHQPLISGALFLAHS